MSLSLNPTRLLARLPQLFVCPPDIPPLHFFLAGFQHHRAEGVWPFLHVGAVLRLRRERWNRYDPQAVAVYYRQEKLGYLSRADNAAVARWLDQGRLLRASIASLREGAPPWGRLQLRLELGPVRPPRMLECSRCHPCARKISFMIAYCKNSL